MHEELPECRLEQRLRFKFDMNLMFTDAFAAHVGSVCVLAYDPDGRLAWKKCESGDALAADGYSMDLGDVPPGEYDLVGWCGLDNGAGDNESFTLSDHSIGVSGRHELQCRMARSRAEDGTAYSRRNLHPLFHGSLHVTVADRAKVVALDSTIVHTMPLVKDTNHVRIVLQQLSGEDIDAEGFSFAIEDENALMHHDNSLLSDETITYREWNKESGEAGIVLGTRDDTATPVKVAVADLTTSRLMADHPAMLTVTNPKGEVAAKIPLTEYALLVKGHYDRPMTDQEYLDRQDHYQLTFFLDKQYHWISSSIVINSWHIVFNNPNL